MGLIRRLISSFTRTRRRPVARRPVATRGVGRRSTAGGLMGAIRGFLRGSRRARI